MKKNLGAKNGVFPQSVFVIATYDEDGTPNAMNAAWAGESTGSEIAMNLGEHQTTENLRNKKAFTVAPADQAHVVQADYFGMAKGAKVDKAKASGLTFVKSENVDAPVIQEFPVTLECEVVRIDDVDGMHRVVGKVVNTIADDSVLDDKGRIDMNKAHFIVFDQVQRSYHLVGETVGQAWGDGKALM